MNGLRFEGDRAVDLRSVPPPVGRVLALAPHPDDFDSVGVTMRFLHTGGSLIRVAVVSGSASGVLDDFVGADPERKRQAREEEQAASLRFFGLSADCLVCLRLREDAAGDPEEGGANEAALRAYLSAEAPDLVVLPHGRDTNIGHQRVQRMFRGWAVDAGRPVTAFYFRDPKSIAFRADVYLAFGEDEARWKSCLLLHHASQQHRNLATRGRGFDERILEVNRAIAREMGLSEPYAEAFEIERFGP